MLRVLHTCQSRSRKALEPSEGENDAELDTLGSKKTSISSLASEIKPFVLRLDCSNKIKYIPSGRTRDACSRSTLSRGIRVTPTGPEMTVIKEGNVCSGGAD